MAAEPTERRDALVERLFGATLGAMDVLSGTVIRADTVRRYAEEAGFGGFEILPIENDFYRFYRLKP